MLAHEAAREQLKQWAVRAEVEDEDFEDEYDAEPDHPAMDAVAKLPKKLRVIGFSLLHRDEDGEAFPEDDDGELRRKHQARQFAALEQLPPGERRRLFRAFFDNLAEAVEQTWQHLKSAPYHQGYPDKVFRAPGEPSATLPRRLSWLDSMTGLTADVRKEVFTPAWLAAWVSHVESVYYSVSEDSVGHLLAAVIDAGGDEAEEVLEILRQSAKNEHEIGGMGRHVTQAMLGASNPAGWEFIEKLLLAAQRQEGLRQVILGTAISAHPEAFHRLLRLIREEKLARFSSVVQAMNEWFGLELSALTPRRVNEVLDLALRVLESPAEREQLLGGADAEPIYFALWAAAFNDAFAAIPLAAKLLSHDSVEVRFVAVLHLTQLRLPAAAAKCATALGDEDLRVALTALNGLTDEHEDEDQELCGAMLFEDVESLFLRLPKKPQQLPPLVWPSAGMQAQQRMAARFLLDSLGELSPTRLLPHLKSFDTWERGRVVGLLAEQKRWDAATRDALFDLAGDASSGVRGEAIEALARATLKPAELPRLEKYLTRKASDLRQGVVSLLLKQPDATAMTSADRLLDAKDKNQRLAGLELLRQLAEGDRRRAECMAKAAQWRDGRKRITKDEQTQLAAVLAADREKVTLDNALGLMDPSERSPAIAPRNRGVRCITPAAVKLLTAIDKLIHERRDTQVQYRHWDGELYDTVLGDDHGFPYPDFDKPIEPQLERLPLAEVWEEWYQDRPKALRDNDGFELLRAFVWQELVESWEWGSLKTWLKRSPKRKAIGDLILGGQQRTKLKYERAAPGVVFWLLAAHPPEGAADFMLDAVETLFALVPEEDIQRLKAPLDRDESRAPPPAPFHYDETREEWRNEHAFRVWTQFTENVLTLHSITCEEPHLIRNWQLQRWHDEPFAGAERCRPDIGVPVAAVAYGAATLADLADSLLGPDTPARDDRESFESLGQFTQPRPSHESRTFMERCPQLGELVGRGCERILEVELARGEAPTPATHAALSLGSLRGCEKLIDVLTALGKEGFKRQTGWYGDRRQGRRETLTHLAGITYPSTDDTPERFAGLAKAAMNNDAFPQERLLELAFMAPQWTGYIETFLQWDGFAEGLYWFLGHMRYVWGVTDQAAMAADMDDDERDDEDDEQRDDEPRSAWDRLIAERTPLSNEERNDGAIDVAWFRRTYEQLTPGRWQAMASAARFAANAAQAKRAKYIAEVLLGEASRDDLIAGIREKHLKENVRLLGLLPPAKGARRDKDVAERYQLLEDYKRYADGLSSMSKPQAQRAVEIGMRNLAQTAGYRDPLRLQWAMEAASTSDLAKGPVSVSKDDVSLTLSLDEQAQPRLEIQRGERVLKSLPKSHKKEPRFVELSARAKELKRQASSVKRSLESAMCRGDAFSGAELAQLSSHALLAPLLGRLVLIGEGIMGYPVRKGKALMDYGGQLEPVKKKETLRIAHPHDLLHSGDWDKWQHECFAAERLQPFKQVFRELYVVTRQEKADKFDSRRYAGQQVNPRQANALWGQRGWSTEDGVWKSFPELGLTVSVQFDYGFTTPLEVEGLTIEAVSFSDHRRSQEVKLADVPPRVFSEAMRDMDLVVSVAHAGGVDPEASASTVEMRSSLLRETCTLLGLNNVRLKKSQAIIKGQLGQYSVHLGGGTVHRLPGGAVCIVPVHSQHRGRLFLPFADDDPRTAEVISKVLLLARDEEIQDPIILEQLRAMA